AAIMAPDVTEDSPEFEAFVKSVVLEITAKAGQKCTAVRRVIVPQEIKPAVVAALKERVAQRGVVGDPRDPATTVGPLASEDQASEVLRSVRTLIDAGATVELGGPEELSSVPQDGAFFPVTLLSFDDARTPAVHEVEAFGPVTSVLGYSGDVADAVEIAALGGGSLVATVCTHSPELA
ncbi:MAG TPA: phenylacetic acid degradation bifunctional protein PaaZ, partial [Kocuria sp.]|nr:phenylacetic acid degradation bifunctional protein PaaZ [Kocuria sp.]